MRANERLLQCVLAVLAVAEHVAAEREQRGVVTVVERLERGRVAVADARGELLVVQAPRRGGSSCFGRGPQWKVRAASQGLLGGA